MKGFKWLFFDADETLFDFKKTERTAFENLVKDVSDIPFDVLYQSYHEINEMLWKRVEMGTLTQEILKTKRFSTWINQHKLDLDAYEVAERFLTMLSNGSYLLPDAERVCHLLTSEYKMAIVTNGIASVQRGRFYASPIHSCFEHLFISEEMGYSKPDQRFFRLALQTIGDVDPHEILIIGDSLTSDIQGGIDSGIATCWFNPKGIKNGTLWKPDYEIRHLADLLNVLKKD